MLETVTPRQAIVAWVLAFVALSVSVWMVYRSALADPFIFDDRDSVVNNASIVRLWPLFGNPLTPGPLDRLKEVPTAGRPLVNWTLAMNYRIGGLDPFGYRVFNLVIHLLSACLLWGIVDRTLRVERFQGRFDAVAAPLGFAVALVWALHPLQTETVVYVTQRTELLMGFLYLLTLYAGLREGTASRRSGRAVWFSIAASACWLGMGCKEVMVSAPLAVVLFDRAFLFGSFIQAFRRRWPLYGALFSSWALLLYLNYDAPRAESAGFNLGVTPIAWWLTQTKVLLMYLKLAIWPWPLVIHYDFPYWETWGQAWPALLAVCLLAAVTALAVVRNWVVCFPLALVGMALAPTFLVPVVTEMAAERRMYLPLAAIVSLVIIGVYQLVRKSTIGSIGLAAAIIAWASILAFVSNHRLDAYSNDLVLWQDTVTHEPENSLAHANLAKALQEKGRREEAAAEYQTAIEITPGYADAHNNLGTLLSAEGRLPEAIEQFKTAIRFKPKHALAHNNLGNALARQNQLPEALVNYRRCIELQPSYAEAHSNLGAALLATDQPQEAIEEYECALKLRPDYAEGHNNLAVVLLRLDRLNEAIEHAQEAIKLRPDYMEAFANLALIYASLNRLAEADTAANKALQLARAQGRTTEAAEIERWLVNHH